MANEQPPAYHALAPAAAPNMAPQQQPYQQQQAVVVQPYAQGQPAYTQQPQQTVVVVQQHPSVSVNSAAHIMLTGLCDCADDFGSCFISWFCGPCANGLNTERVQIGSCCVCCVSYALFPCCTGAYVRGKVYQLAGAPDPGFCSNFCTHCCCSCIALAQEWRATEVLKTSGVVMTRA